MSSDFRNFLVIIILWTVLGVLVASYISQPIAEPDLWWHITVGKWIWAHKELPRVDQWNMFGAGKPWRAYSWLFELIVSGVDAKFSAPGLIKLQLFFAALLVFSYMLSMASLAKDRTFGAILGAYIGIAAFNHYTIRPQIFVWIYFALSLAIADKLLRRESKRGILYLFLIGFLWANTHLTAALGLFSIVVWTISRPRLAVQAGAAFFVGTLFTPYLGGEWITFFSKTGHPLTFSAISEFQPATIIRFSTDFLLLLTAIVLINLTVDRSRFRLSQLLVGGTFVFLGLAFVKFLPMATIAVGAVLSVWWRESLEKVSQKKSRLEILGSLGEGLYRGSRYIDKLNPLVTFGLALLLALPTSANLLFQTTFPINLRETPREALDFIISKNLPRPVLNEFGTGGYVMYRLSDERGELKDKVTIDGRTNVNPPEIWDEYMNAYLGRKNWKRYIEHVKPGTVLWRQGSALPALLRENPDWCEVFDGGSSDNASVIFISKVEWEKRRGEFQTRDCP